MLFRLPYFRPKLFVFVRFLWRMVVGIFLCPALPVVDRIFFFCFGMSCFVCIVLAFVDISLISLLSPELSGFVFFLFYYVFCRDRKVHTIQLVLFHSRSGLVYALVLVNTCVYPCKITKSKREYLLRMHIIVSYKKKTYTTNEYSWGHWNEWMIFVINQGEQFYTAS